MSFQDNTIPVAQPFLETLRTETSDSHKNLESLSISQSITSPEVTKAAYAHYLNIMLDVVKSTEDAVFPILTAVIPDLDGRTKTQQLKNDLAHIGVSQKNPVAIFDGNYSAAFAFGILYVVEGSSLGGRFILKNIESVLGYGENNGASYFAGYGNKTGSSWKNFLNVLTQYESDHQAGAEIIAGADFAFNAIHNHFSENSPE